MAKFEVSRKAYLAVTGERTRNLFAQLAKYLANPAEAEAHDLRTCIRRFQSSVRALPASQRETRRNGSFSRRCRRLLETTATIRDLDVVVARLRESEFSAATGQLQETLLRLRSRNLKPASRIAKSLLANRPELGGPDEASLEKRFRKVCRRLTSRAAKYLSEARSDPSNVEALHALRRECRRIRYELELLSGDSRAKGMADSLGEWQDALGSIRDHDMVLATLKKFGSPASVRGLVIREGARRRSEYSEFSRRSSQLGKLLRQIRKRAA